MGKKMIIILLFVVVCSCSAFAEHFRLGVPAGVELFNSPNQRDLRREFDEQLDIFPGLYWEVIPRNLGFGMTYLVNFHRHISTYEEIDYLWFLDWIGTWDFRYHFFREGFIDPFIEAGIGNAGRVDITAYDDYGLYDEREALQLSIFGQVGGGIAFRFTDLHVGAKALLRFLNEPPPATQFDPYPLKNIHLSLFGGVSF